MEAVENFFLNDIIVNESDTSKHASYKLIFFVSSRTTEVLLQGVLLIMTY